MKRRFILLLLCTGIAVEAQAQKLIDVAFGRNLLADSNALDFSFRFNRSEADEGGKSLYITTFPLGKGAVGFKPAAEVNVGASPEVSPDNVLARLGFDYQRSFSKGGGWNVGLLPEALASYTADKNFDTRLIYAHLNARLLLSKTLKSGGFAEGIAYALLGVAFQPGQRHTDSLDTNSFFRVQPAASASVEWKQRIVLSGAGRLHFIWNDEPVVDTGMYPDVEASLTYIVPMRKPGAVKLGLTGKYQYGYAEPKFERRHSLLFGLSLRR